MSEPDTFVICPDPDDPALSQSMQAWDEHGTAVTTNVVTERALTLFLNATEVVTMMSIGDHPDLLALGYLFNQNIIDRQTRISAVEFDDELGVIVVRTKQPTSFEASQQKRIRTSGCAQGTIFASVMDQFEQIQLPATHKVRSSWLQELSRQINHQPSLYLSAGAIHGCVLCQQNRPLAYFEDVGRHNAVDKIAGWMLREQIDPEDKIFYTTGRLTSEMVIKTVLMGIPILVSRSGFTAWGVKLAQQAGLTMIGRAKGKRFLLMSGAERMVFDTGSDNQQIND